MRTLIIPCAGKSTRFPNMRPKYLLTHPDGSLMIEKVISGFCLGNFDRVIITIVRDHSLKHEAETILKQAFGQIKRIEIFVLNEFTAHPGETVFRTLVDCNIHGSFLVRDADNYVRYDEPETKNFVVGLNLDNHTNISNMKGKSYLLVNNQGIVTDIIEKQIRSNIICLGVYSFESVDSYISAYKDLVEATNGELYLSHIISYLIMKSVECFNYIQAVEYEDWGTLDDWERVKKKSRTYFVDIDGVIIRNVGKYGSRNWQTSNEVISENVELIRALVKQGGQVIFVTSRPESNRPTLESILKQNEIDYFGIVMGCNHSTRVLINDFAKSNPYPSAVAVSLPRNGVLSDYVSVPE